MRFSERPGAAVPEVGSRIVLGAVVAIAASVLWLGSWLLPADASLQIDLRAKGMIAFGMADGHIWVMNADGSGRRRVTSSRRLMDVGPTWSPDGTQIAFKGAPRGHPLERSGTIFVIRVDGRDRHRVSPNKDVEAPAWSPDGRLIAFQLRGRIATVRPNGRDLRILPIYGGCPSWTPDSNQLAICGDDGEIYLINADGTMGKRLTRSPGTDIPGPWSPDGTHLSFSSDRAGTADIYVMNRDGRLVKRLTRLPGNEAPNAWLRGAGLLFPFYANGSMTARWQIVDATTGVVKPFSLPGVEYDPIAWLPG